MKRALTVVQRKGMEQSLKYVPRQKHIAPDCSNCRNSRVEVVKEKFAFVCKIGFAALDGIAKNCPGYRDCREPVLINYLRSL